MLIWENGSVREMTEEEIAAREERMRKTPQEKIWLLRQALAESDYKALKFAEGMISEAEYAPIRAERQAWRDEINRLEGME